jgi:hypothetical protein
MDSSGTMGQSSMGMTASAVPPPTPARSGKRFVSSLIVLIGGVLALTSAWIAWWSLSGSGVTLSFLPGSSGTLSYGGTTTTNTYASGGLGQVGALYEAILALTIVSGVLAIIAGILGIVLRAGRMKPSTAGKVKGLSIAALVLVLVAVAVAPGLQPYLINQSSDGSSFCSTFNGPCSSYWGSSTVSGTTFTWGAAIGWYLALVGFVLILVGLILWNSARNEPWGSPGTTPGGM